MARLIGSFVYCSICRYVVKLTAATQGADGAYTCQRCHKESR